MTQNKKAALGLALLCIPHLLYELRVGLISAAHIIPVPKGPVVPLAADSGIPLLRLATQLANLPLVMALVGVFAAAALVGSRFLTAGMRPSGFETKPWTESTADFCFAITVAFHVTLLGSFAPWTRTGGHPAWALVPGVMAAMGVHFARKRPKDSTLPESAVALSLPVIVLVCGAASFLILRTVADGHVASHLASRVRLGLYPSLPGFLKDTAIRALLLCFWTTGLLILAWGLSARCGRRVSLSAGLIATAAIGYFWISNQSKSRIGDAGDRRIGPANLSPAGGLTLVLLHDEAEDQRRITPRMLPERVWSLFLSRPLDPITFIDPPVLKPDTESTVIAADLFAPSGIIQALPEQIDEGLRIACMNLHRPGSCGTLLERISRGPRRAEYDKILYALLDENQFRLDENARSLAEAGFERQGGSESARIEIHVNTGGAKAEGVVLLSVTEESSLPGPEEPTPTWSRFIEHHLVARVPVDSSAPIIFENIPPGRYILGILVRGNRQRFLVESGLPVGPFEVGPGSVRLPAVAIGVRALNGTVGIPALGP